MDLRVYENVDELSRAAARMFADTASDAIDESGRFAVALSGGTTPERMYRLLAEPPFREEIDWPNVHFFWGDERWVPPDSLYSNERMARLSLLDRVAVSESNVFPIRWTGGPDMAAREYEQVIRDMLPDLRLDLVLLGLGTDGHTASLFPGDPSVHEKERLVVASHGAPPIEERITMTRAMLNRARRVVFLVAGPDKAEALERVLRGPLDLDQTPAQAIARGPSQVTFLVDKAAAAKL